MNFFLLLAAWRTWSKHGLYIAGRPVGVINNYALKLMFWAPAGWRCTVLFWAALAYVEVGGGEVYARCRSQAWEITSSTQHKWNVRPERKKRRHVCRFLNHQPLLSHCCPAFLLLFSSVFKILTWSIFYWMWRNRTQHAALLRVHHAVCLLIFAPLLPNFTQVTHTHLSVFKAHKPSCLIQSSVPVCGRTFWVICALLDFSQGGHNGSWLRNRNEKWERRYLKKSRRWKGWPLEIQLDSLPVQQHNSNYTL